LPSRLLKVPALALLVFLCTTAVPAAPAARSTGGETHLARLKQRRWTQRRIRHGHPRWYTQPTFVDPTAGDFLDGEDPDVRRAAVEALGKLNGSVVVADAGTGRVLSIVNQKVALSSGYVPCSTIKPFVGLAALEEGVVEPGEKVWFQGKWFMTMTHGLEISNNVYFDHLGEQLGFDRVRKYARLFGLGEKVGWRIPGEQLARFPDDEHPSGVGRMASFGDGITVTPLQMAAFVSALANGGSLYYLQYPRTAGAETLEPKLKRKLPIGSWLPEIHAGMRAAVRKGTARRARLRGYDVAGKTGTCTHYAPNERTRLGWFVSWGEFSGRKIAVVVLLRGGPSMHGPLASEVAGKIYRSLAQSGYFSRTGNAASAPTD